jgi:hypothetical protein
MRSYATRLVRRPGSLRRRSASAELCLPAVTVAAQTIRRGRRREDRKQGDQGVKALVALERSRE